MNDMTPITSKLMLKELNYQTGPSPIAEADIGETIIIEGRYFSSTETIRNLNQSLN